MSYKDLLPKNVSEEQRAVDQAMHERLEKLKQADFNMLPMSCDVSLLPHLAYMFSLELGGLDIEEQRKYISGAMDKYRHDGSLKAVKNVLEVVFGKAVIKRWFEYDGEPHHFRANLTLKADPSKVYDKAKFDTAKALLNSARNEQSVFDGFDIKVPDALGEYKLNGGGVMDVKLKNELNLKAVEANINITGGVMWTI
jgi:phage tail P2-like protein